MAILNRDMFLRIQDELSGKKVEIVEIAPDIQVQVVQLTAEAALELFTMSENDSPEMRNQLGTLRWVAACCRGEDGRQVFDIDDLRKMPLGIVQKLAAAVNKVNGLADPEAVAESEKNSVLTIS